MQAFGFGVKGFIGLYKGCSIGFHHGLWHLAKGLSGLEGFMKGFSSSLEAFIPMPGVVEGSQRE